MYAILKTEKDEWVDLIFLMHFSYKKTPLHNNDIVVVLPEFHGDSSPITGFICPQICI
jgi:hypothetical protein